MELIGKHLGLFSERTQPGGADGEPIQLNVCLGKEDVERAALPREAPAPCPTASGGGRSDWDNWSTGGR
jgi:hypothetical protein